MSVENERWGKFYLVVASGVLLTIIYSLVVRKEAMDSYSFWKELLVLGVNVFLMIDNIKKKLKYYTAGTIVMSIAIVMDLVLRISI